MFLTVLTVQSKLCKQIQVILIPYEMNRNLSLFVREFNEGQSNSPV